MSPGRVEDYISRLESELRRRGIDDPRILAEAREHLVDAVEEGRQRGLSVEEAEHEALERFGAPGIVAAHAEKERERLTRLTGAMTRAWQHKWWILAPTALAAVVASVVSSYFLPVRYRSEATLLVVPQRVPGDYGRPVVTGRIEDRLRSINQQVRSRTRLERIIEEFNLYSDRRKTHIMQDIVDDMSDAIEVAIVQGDVFRVAFSSDDPRTAMQVTDRLMSFFIDESLRERTELAKAGSGFLEAQVADVRRQIIDYEQTLKGLKAQHGTEPLSQADVLPYVVLQEKYRELLAKVQDTRVAENLERRQIGEAFKILAPARLPEAPEDPNRLRMMAIGGLVGLLIGLVLLVLRRSSNGVPPTLAEA